MLPLYIVACISHLALAIYTSKATHADVVARWISILCCGAGAMFLMLSMWWYVEKLAPQLERDTWPLRLFVVDDVAAFGSAVTVLTMHNATTVYWTRFCTQKCDQLPVGTRVLLYQNPQDANDLSDKSATDQSLSM
jgi:hypothetical protein